MSTTHVHPVDRLARLLVDGERLRRRRRASLTDEIRVDRSSLLRAGALGVVAISLGRSRRRGRHPEPRPPALAGR